MLSFEYFRLSRHSAGRCDDPAARLTPPSLVAPLSHNPRESSPPKLHQKMDLEIAHKNESGQPGFLACEG